MALELYNTLSRKIEKITPIDGSIIRMYNCGPTVYWVQHIGNMRAVFVVDVLVRTLQFLGFETNLVRNITDVGHLTGDNLGDADTGSDRMENASLREKMTPEEIAEKYTNIYLEHVKKLGSLPPNQFPKATEHIGEMIKMIETLLEGGYAYITSKAIYFDTSMVLDYTKLSKQKLDDLQKGQGHGVVSDTDKKNSTDFSLWFFKTGTHKNALQTWVSPFTSILSPDGRGFPGWHIECSAISKYYLGDTLDIHIGGIEHVPIHHTNEIAQSEAANKAIFANHWLHYEHLLVDGGKMSKSEGTSFTIDDIESRGFTAITLRYFFLQAHYRSKQNFTWEALEASDIALRKLYRAFLLLPLGGRISQKYNNLFTTALSTDLGTPTALALTWELIKDNDTSDGDKRATLIHFDKVLGLSLDAIVNKEIPDSVKHLAERRVTAKNEKDWELADKLRDEITSLGFTLIDTKDGYVIK
jgi:cysteinyl-tRNA synthetase